MSEWVEYKIEQLMDVQNGYAFKSGEYINEGLNTFEVLKMGHIEKGGGLRKSPKKDFVPKTENLKRWVLNKDDIVMAMTDMKDNVVILGVPAMIDRSDHYVLNQRVARLTVKNHELADIGFIYNYFKWEDFLFELQSKASSGVQVNLSTTAIKESIVKAPPLPEQKSIAAVLSSLDDKIDLLHRQNQTLEAVAATLFRQWFVEEAQEDWEEVTLSDVTTRITDGSHASPPTVEVGLPMASVKDMYQWGINKESCRQISQDDFDELVRTDCRPLKNDILIAKDGSYLKHVFVAEDDMDVVILSSIAILRPNGKYHPLLLATFLKLESTIEGLANIVTGAVIPRIVLKDFRKYKLLLPPKQLQDKALLVIEPIYKKCWENDRQIRTLETLRDTLLPKLMSGEVRVAA